MLGELTDLVRNRTPLRECHRCVSHRRAAEPLAHRVDRAIQPSAVRPRTVSRAVRVVASYRKRSRPTGSRDNHL